VHDTYRIDDSLIKIRRRLREVEMRNRVHDIPSNDIMSFIMFSTSAINCMSVYLWPDTMSNNDVELQYARVLAKVIPEESPQQLEQIIHMLQSCHASEYEHWLLGESLVKLSKIWNYGLKGVTRDWRLSCDLIWQAAELGHPEAMTMAAVILHCHMVRTVDPVIILSLFVISIDDFIALES
jgi:hypothetical protein